MNGDDMGDETEVYCIRLRHEGMGDPDDLLFMDLNRWEREFPEIVETIRDCDYEVEVGRQIDPEITKQSLWIDKLFYGSEANTELPCEVEDLVTFVVPYEYI